MECLGIVLTSQTFHELHILLFEGPQDFPRHVAVDQVHCLGEPLAPLPLKAVALLLEKKSSVFK